MPRSNGEILPLDLSNSVFVGLLERLRKLYSLQRQIHLQSCSNNINHDRQTWLTFLRLLIRQSPPSWSPIYTIHPIPRDFGNPIQGLRVLLRFFSFPALLGFFFYQLERIPNIFRSTLLQLLQRLHKLPPARTRRAARKPRRHRVRLDDQAAHAWVRPLRALVVC